MPPPPLPYQSPFQVGRITSSALLSAGLEGSPARHCIKAPELFAGHRIIGCDVGAKRRDVGAAISDDHLAVEHARRPISVAQFAQLELTPAPRLGLPLAASSAMTRPSTVAMITRPL